MKNAIKHLRDGISQEKENRKVAKKKDSYAGVINASEKIVEYETAIAHLEKVK